MPAKTDATTTYFIIARHGETEWNVEGRHQGHLDSELTKRGLLQAEALAERLSGESFASLYSSDLGRALKTAEIIGRRCGKNVLIDVRLRERNLGIFHGLTREEIRARFPDQFERYRSDPEYRVPQGESALDRTREHVECLEELARRHAGQRIVLVGHGGLLNSVFRHIMEIPPGRRRQYSLANGSVNIIAIPSNGKWRVETWGDVSHLRNVSTMDDDGE